MPQPQRILYCRCRHDYALEDATRDAVLRGLCESQAGFEAVDDLCGLAGRRDPMLAELAEADDLRIAACHPRAVRLLFEAADSPLAAGRVTLANMRTDEPETVLSQLLEHESDGEA
jgi:hypothetical protein